MRYVLASLLLLCGCKCPEQPIVPPVVQPSKERDAYIDRLESEASEGAAALGVAVTEISGNGLGLVSLTKERLEGIKRPSKEQIAKFTKALKDKAAMDAERAKAEAVDYETGILYDQVVERDRENKALKDTIDKMNRANAFGEMRNKFLTVAGIFAFVGAGLLVASTFIQRGRMAGIVLVLLSAVFGSLPFVIQDAIDSPLFPYVFWGLILGGIAYGLYEAKRSHKDIKERLLPVEKEQASKTSS